MATRREMPVLLAGWILQDGNYPEFVAGEPREFALEFDVDGARPLRPDPRGAPGWEATGSGADLRVTADVLFAHQARDGRGCFVLDFGLRAFTCHHPAPDSGEELRVGDRLSGIVSVGVDPFLYFEELTRRLPDVPELIYRWQVERIELDQTPLVAVPPGDPRYPADLPDGEGPVHLRDVAHERWRRIGRTRVRDDDPAGAPSYRLACVATPEPPTRAFRSGGHG